MTEAEWLTCTDPTPMLECLRGKASDRKLRLFEVACCRRIWRLITDAESRGLVETVERFADGLAEVQEIRSLDFNRLTDICDDPEEPFRSAFMVAGHVGYSFVAPICGYGSMGSDFEDALETARGAVDTIVASFDGPDDKLARSYSTEGLLAAYQQHMARAQAAREELQAAEQAAQSLLLRCIFGNRFRVPPALPSAWLNWNDGTVVRLARAAYEERHLPAGTLDPARLAVLADALEEAGCTDADILAHCRGPGPHVRGCWVVDLLLGKE